MTDNEKTLLRKAVKRFPGKMLSFVSDKTCWDDCFSVEDIAGINKLVLWYNVGQGTYNESLTVGN